MIYLGVCTYMSFAQFSEWKSQRLYLLIFFSFLVRIVRLLVTRCLSLPQTQVQWNSYPTYIIIIDSFNTYEWVIGNIDLFCWFSFWKWNFLHSGTSTNYRMKWITLILVIRPVMSPSLSPSNKFDSVNQIFKIKHGCFVHYKHYW